LVELDVNEHPHAVCEAQWLILGTGGCGARGAGVVKTTLNSGRFLIGERSAHHMHSPTELLQVAPAAMGTARETRSPDAFLEQTSPDEPRIPRDIVIRREVRIFVLQRFLIQRDTRVYFTIIAF
jgi:hypothetical protein